MVTITLNTGLRFTDGAQSSTSLTLPVGPTGIVSVPAVQAVGSAGTYAITATLGTATAFTSTTVTAAAAAPATLVAFGAATVSGTITAIPAIVAAAVSNSAYAFIDDNGTLYVSGAAFGLDALTPVAAQSNVAKVWLYSEPNASTTVMTLSRTGTAFISSTQKSRPVFTQLTGHFGVIRDLCPVNGANYVVTNTGIFYNGTIYGNSHTSPLAMIPNTMGVTAYSFWSGVDSDKSFRAGGIYSDTPGTLYRFEIRQGSSTTPTITKQASKPSAAIRTIQASRNTVYALDVNGRLWTQNSSSGFVMQQNDISFTEMASWMRYIDSYDYIGATLLGTDGAVYQVGRDKAMVRVNGLQSVSVTRMFAGDGIYQVLASDGSLWSWLGNNDAGVGTATLVSKAETADEFVAFAWHDTTISGIKGYSGWGIALNQGACTLT